MVQKTVSISRNRLVSALKPIVALIPAKTTLPILSNVLLRVVPGSSSFLEIMGTNPEAGLINRFPIPESEPWEVTVPGRQLLDIVALSRDDTIALEFVPKTMSLELSGATFNSRLLGITAQEFPPMGQDQFFPEEKTVAVQAQDLMKAVRRCAACIAKGIERPILMGMNFSSAKDHINIETADGFRLARHTLESNNPGAFQAPAVICFSAVRALQDAFNDDNGIITIVNKKSQVIFITADTVLEAQCIDGNFPPIDVILPKSNAKTNRVRVQAGELERILKQNAVMDLSYCKFEFAPTDDREGILTVSSNFDQVGWNKATMGIQVETLSEPCQFAASNRMISDAIRSAESGWIKIEFENGSNKALVFSALEDPAWVSVVMPVVMRV